MYSWIWTCDPSWNKQEFYALFGAFVLYVLIDLRKAGTQGYGKHFLPYNLSKSSL